jgi:hypothetical protein
LLYVGVHCSSEFIIFTLGVSLPGLLCLWCALFFLCFFTFFIYFSLVNVYFWYLCGCPRLISQFRIWSWLHLQKLITACWVPHTVLAHANLPRPSHKSPSVQFFQPTALNYYYCWFCFVYSSYFSCPVSVIICHRSILLLFRILLFLVAYFRSE